MSKKTRKNKKSRKIDLIIGIVCSVVVLGIIALFVILRSQKLSNSETVTLYIPTGSDYSAVVDSLDAHHCIDNHAVFNTLSRIRKYSGHVKSGCYKLKPGTPVWSALTKLYYGNQDAVSVTINKYRTKQTLCEYISKRLEMNADELLYALNDSVTCAKYGYTTENIMGMFIQNTYDIYWNCSVEKLMERMHKESEKFWTNGRIRKCNKLNLSANEVIVLASIIEEESNKNDEKPDIASVYLNRIRKGMLLQADPTLKYALGDFTIRRLLNKHMEVESPYNTYKYKGLPPGPICIPSIASIDAVLQNKQTDYLYFCAKADFSGYHAFAATLAEHNANAAAFHAEMNKRKIYK